MEKTNEKPIIIKKKKLIPLVLQLQRNSPMKSQNSFSVNKKKNHFCISIKRAKNIKINYLKISFSFPQHFSNCFSKNPKVLILNILKYKLVFKMVFSPLKYT